MKDTIRQLIQQALTRLTQEGVLPEGLSPAIQVENTKDKSHGDFASNIAMMLAKPAGLKPRDLAEKLINAVATWSDPSKTGLDKAKATLELATALKEFAGADAPKLANDLRKLDGALRAVGAGLTLLDPAGIGGYR